MALARDRFIFPPELDQAVAAHAQAVRAGDGEAAERYVLAVALEAHRAALRRAAAINPPHEFEVIARARLGHQYFVKVRFREAGESFTLQNRWLRENDGPWRIIEVEDLAVRSPWTKPDTAQPMNPKA